MFTCNGKVIATKPFTNKKGECKSDCVVVETDKVFQVGFAPKGQYRPGDDVIVISACEDGKWSVKFMQ